MDPRFSHEGKMKKRKRFRRMCSLCNEPCRDTDEQMRHYSSALHKHMKRIKRKQYSYTKNLRSLDEKIKASEEHNEPLIGLEYIYQYAADRRGVIPYVCMLCNSVYKINTVFFHVAGIKHRTLYLSKTFPALGFDRSFKAKTPSDFRRLLTAAEIIEKSHGRRQINVCNTFFNPKKNGGITFDSDTGGEGLSSSEDEINNPDLTLANSSTTKVNDGNNNRSVNHSGNLPFHHDTKGGPPSNVGRGDPAFCYDGRRGPEVQDGCSDRNRPLRDHNVSGFSNDGYSDRSYHDGRSDMNRPLRDHHVSGFHQDDHGDRNYHEGHSDMNRPLRGNEASQFQHGGRGDHNYRNGRSDMNLPLRDQGISEFQHDGIRDPNYPEDHLPMELSYPQRGPDRSKVPGRTDFPDDRNPRSQMNRDGTVFQSNDIRGPTLQGRDGITGQNRAQNHPLGFSEDPSLAFPMHRGGMGFQYDNKEGPLLQGGPRHNDSQVRNKNCDFAFKHDQNTRSRGNPHGDLDMSSMGLSGQQVDCDDLRSKTQNHPPGFFGDHDLQSQMHGGRMRVQSDSKEGPLFPGGRRHSGSHVRNDGSGFAFDESAQLIDNPQGDLNMPSMGPLHPLGDRNGIKSQNRAQNHPTNFSGDCNLGSKLQQSGREFQYDDRHRSLVPRQTGNQLRKENDEFAFKPDQSTRLIGGPRGDPNMPSKGPLHQPVDIDNFKGRGRTQRPGDHALNSAMHRDGMEFPYEDRQRPLIQDGSRLPDHQVKNDGLGFAFQLDPSTRLLSNTHGDLDRDDMPGRNRTPGFSGDPDLRSRMHLDAAPFQYNDSRGTLIQDGSRHTDRNFDRDFAFRTDESRPSLGKLHGDLDMPPIGQVDHDKVHRGGTSFQYDDVPGAVPQGGLGHTSDYPRERLLSNSDHDIPPMKSFYRQGDPYGLEEKRTEDFHPGFSGDHSLPSQKNRGGKVDDGRRGIHGRFQMHGDRITFRELKAAHEAGFDLQHSGMDKQGVNYDSDKEVRSMDLSNCDPDEFLCNAELFEFVKTFQIQSFEDEQFALKVRDFLTNGSIRYKNYKEEALRRRIAEEKEKLEEEKKAFLEIQKSKEHPKKENLIAPRRSQDPKPSSYFPIATSNNRGLTSKPKPLMSLLVDLPPGPANEPQHSPSYSGQGSWEELRSPTMPAKNMRPGSASKPQHSSNYPRQRGSMEELRSPTMPAKSIRPEPKSRRNPEFIQTPSEVRRGERSNQPPLRGERIPPRRHSDGSRNVTGKYGTHTESMNY